MMTDQHKPNRPPVGAWGVYVLTATLFSLVVIGAILAEGWAAPGNCP
ncbi:hypothetical protein BH160DRAFT_2696 [Burkholderia sp. H160]|nr:hypothetical protein BH160DRAFT_2696 [Burkholderia sp. H160]